MRGMRNRIAHGYFDINLDVVWQTVQTALLKQLPAVQQDAEDEERNEAFRETSHVDWLRACLDAGSEP
jgi:hypothetical protein